MKSALEIQVVEEGRVDWRNVRSDEEVVWKDIVRSGLEMGFST